MAIMSKWACLQHVEYEGPGLIATVAARRGLELERHHFWSGSPVPRIDEVDGLVVMGGPMSVNDVENHPSLEKERELLGRAVASGTPVLGVCLGAQLLAASLGVEVYDGGNQEVGTGTVELTQMGCDDPVLGPAGPELPVFHWHGDTFEIPAGAAHLARSDLYESQAFRAGECAYGFQFHLELDSGLLSGLGPHLPQGVEVGQGDLDRLMQVGESVIERFFERAQETAA